MMKSIIAFGAICISLMASSAVAAPQILGLSVVRTPIPLSCTRGKCLAELTVFCLQKKRDDPEPGQRYRIAEPGGVVLHLGTVDGTKHTVNAADHLDIRSERGFTAVRVSLDESVLATLQATEAHISVNPGVLLIPEAQAGDPDPITETEIAFAKEALRPTAAQWLDGTHDKPAAAHFVSRLINATPIDGPMSSDKRQAIWRTAIGDPETTRQAAGGARATEILVSCQFRVEVGRYRTLRRCLQVKQDSLVQDMNLRYWKSLDAGS